jgi:hypothetical protein
VKQVAESVVVIEAGRGRPEGLIVQAKPSLMADPVKPLVVSGQAEVPKPYRRFNPPPANLQRQPIGSHCDAEAHEAAFLRYRQFGDEETSGDFLNDSIRYRR